MTLSKTEKIELLMDSFNLFKEIISQENIDSDNIAGRIEGSIVKMMKIDIRLGTEMWENILISYNRIGKYGNDTHTLTSGLIAHLRNQITIDQVSKIILNNSIIKQVIYNKAASPDELVIAHLIENKDFINADELLNMVYQNENHIKGVYRNDDVFGEYFDLLVRIYCSNLDKESAKFIYSWLDKVEAKKYKASIKIELIDLL